MEVIPRFIRKYKCLRITKANVKKRMRENFPLQIILCYVLVLF